MSSEATQTVSVYDVMAWLETNKKLLIMGFVAAVVIGFGIAIYRYNSDQKEFAASDALLKLKAALGTGGATSEPEAGDYLKVAQQFPGTSAAERALLLAGSALFTEGKYAEAQNQFSNFLRDRPQSSFAATAAYGVAAALEAQGKREEALTSYQNLSVRFPNSAVLDDSKLAVARIYEAKNQPEQALRNYEELIKPGANGMAMASSEAMMRKQALLAKHPELAKTNAPASMTNSAAAMTNAPVIRTNTLTTPTKTNSIAAPLTNSAK